MRVCVMLVGLAAAGCTSLAGLDDLTFGSGHGSGGAGAASVGGGGMTAAGGSGGGGGQGTAGAPPCGIGGPFDVALAEPFAPSAPKIAAIPGRWGIAWKSDDNLLFTTIDHDGVQSATQSFSAASMESAVASDGAIFYVPEIDAGTTMVQRLEADGQQLEPLSIMVASPPADLLPFGGDGGMYFAARESVPPYRLGYGSLGTQSAMTVTWTSVELAPDEGREFRGVGFAAGLSLATRDTVGSDKLVVVTPPSSPTYFDHESMRSTLASVRLGGAIYFSATSYLWRCPLGGGPCDLNPEPIEREIVTTDGERLWTTGNPMGGTYELVAYDFDDGPAAARLTLPLDASAIGRPALAHDGTAFGVAWLEGDKVRFATVRPCE